MKLLSRDSTKLQCSHFQQSSILFSSFKHARNISLTKVHTETQWEYSSQQLSCLCTDHIYYEIRMVPFNENNEIGKFNFGGWGVAAFLFVLCFLLQGLLIYFFIFQSMGQRQGFLFKIVLFTRNVHQQKWALLILLWAVLVGAAVVLLGICYPASEDGL